MQSVISIQSQVPEINLTPGALAQRLVALHPRRRLSLLDSCATTGARLLIAGFDPFETVEVSGSVARVNVRGEAEARVIKASALKLLDERIARHIAPLSTACALPSGACIATLSYELAHQLERSRSNPVERQKLAGPDAVFAFYDALVVHDYERQKTFIVSHDAKRASETEEALRNAPLVYERETHAATVAVSNMTREKYLSAVLRIKEHIAAGDIYQANLTQQFSCALPQSIEAEHLFMRLRREHPAPFAAFIRRRDDTVVSISPERFLRVINNAPDARLVEATRLVEAWPIKGTRPRGKNAVEDARLRAELLSSEKDRAENVMIVDLLRNDLGRVCRYGSVEVLELCALAEHPTLFHLVSKVRGRLRDEVTAGELLRAAFPCGSITGAPKIRAMEIISEVETVPRGLSMGAIG